MGVDVEEMDRRIQSGADLAKVERDRQDLPEELDRLEAEKAQEAKA